MSSHRSSTKSSWIGQRGTLSRSHRSPSFRWAIQKRTLYFALAPRIRTLIWQTWTRLSRRHAVNLPEKIIASWTLLISHQRLSEWVDRVLKHHSIRTAKFQTQDVGLRQILCQQWLQNRNTGTKSWLVAWEMTTTARIRCRFRWPSRYHRLVLEENNWCLSLQLVITASLPILSPWESLSSTWSRYWLSRNQERKRPRRVKFLRLRTLKKIKRYCPWCIALTKGRKTYRESLSPINQLRLSKP